MGKLEQDTTGAGTSPSGLLTRRRFLTAAGLSSAGFVFYSGEMARHEIEIVPRAIHIANLPAAFHGLRIAQLSDIHYDNFSEPSFVRRAVQHINALAPDLVLLTGDFISKGSDIAFVGPLHAHRCAEILKEITCPQRYAVMGNHDAAVGAEMVTDALATANITVLSDSYVPLERDGQRLWLVGLRDASTADLLPNLDTAMPPLLPREPIILMVHEPDYMDIFLHSPLSMRTDLVLSGHSHGGQIRMPLLGPVFLPIMGRHYVEGLFHFPRNEKTIQLYVNRGLGTVGLPLRLNCPPEITLITLSAEPA